MTEHIVKSYDEELKFLAGRIAEMGGLAEASVEISIQSLKRQDVKEANKVIKRDKKIDDMQQEIEEQSVRLIALRQPVASDLHAIVAALRISNDLERVGDLAKNIAKRVILIGDVPRTKKLSQGVDHLSEVTQLQLKKVLDAFAQRDEKLANLVRESDEEVDALYTSLFRELLTYMMEDPRNISMCAHLLFCAKNIERIGDHATNIAENVHYMVFGAMPDSDRPKSDELTSQMNR